MSSSSGRRLKRFRPPSVLSVVGWLLLILAYLGVVATLLGNWYTGTTIRISDTSKAGIGVLSSVVASLAAIEFTRLTHVYPRWWSRWPEIRDRHPVKWLLRMASGSLIAGAAAGLVAYYYVLLATPYLRGQVLEVRGSVREFTESHTRARICSLWVTLDLESGDVERVCFERGFASDITIGPGDLQPGEPVTVRQQSNVLGTSIVSIERNR